MRLLTFILLSPLLPFYHVTAASDDALTAASDEALAAASDDDQAPINHDIAKAQAYVKASNTLEALDQSNIHRDHARSMMANVAEYKHNADIYLRIATDRVMRHTMNHNRNVAVLGNWNIITAAALRANEAWTSLDESAKQVEGLVDSAFACVDDGVVAEVRVVSFLGKFSLSP